MKILRFIRSLQIVVGVVILLGGIAWAQAKPEGAYREKLKAATAAEKRGDIEKALDEFIAAYALSHEDYRVTCSIARLAFRVQKRCLIEAAKYFEICTRSADRPKTARGIERRGAEIIELEIARSHIVTVTVRADDGASIFAGGEFAGVAPLPFRVFLEPGTTTIEARMEAETIKRNITGQRGDEFTIDLAKPEAQETAPPVATVSPALSSPPFFPTLPALGPAREQAPASRAPERVRVSPTPWQTFRSHLPVVGGAGGLAALACAGAFLTQAHNAEGITQRRINDSARAYFAGNPELQTRHIDEANTANVEAGIFRGFGIGCAVLSGVLFSAAGVSAAIDSGWLFPRSAGLKGSIKW